MVELMDIPAVSPRSHEARSRFGQIGRVNVDCRVRLVGILAMTLNASRQRIMTLRSRSCHAGKDATALWKRTVGEPPFGVQRTAIA